MAERNEQQKEPGSKAAEDRTAGNPPVAPVDDYDLGKVDKDRRMFGNGDTDREDLKP